MAGIRKLLLLDPSKQLLMEFQTKTEQVVDESTLLLESVPEVPTEEITKEHIAGAREILNCMAAIQVQLKDLEKTYKHMKNYVQTVCIDAQCDSIESTDAIGYLSSKAYFDQKTLKENNSDLYQQYIKQTAPFLVVKRKK
jgi:hypothetical protein